MISTKQFSDMASLYVRCIFWGLFGLVATLGILEVVKYQGFVANHLGIGYTWVCLWAILILFVVKNLFHLKINIKVSRAYVFGLIPIIAGITLFLLFFEQINYRNYVFSELHIDPYGLAQLSFLSPASMVLFIDKSFIRRYYRQLFFIYGIVFFIFTVFIKWAYPVLFTKLDSEDSSIEYVTSLLYFLAALLSLRASSLVRLLPKIDRKVARFWKSLLIVCALGMLLVTFEELSWGQRLFDIKTPEELSKINLQNETNLHNIDFVFSHVYDAYLLLGIYGLFSWIIKDVRLDSLKKVKLLLWPFLSEKYLFPYFLYMTVYVIWRYSNINKGFEPWEEVAEVFMAAGVFVIFYSAYRKIVEKTTKST